MRLAFLADDLAPSQASLLLIRAVNAAVNGNGEDVVVFVRNGGHPCHPAGFAVLGENDLPGFTGAVVATSFAGALGLLRHVGPTRKGLYMQDVEWTRRLAPYEEWRAVYGDPSLTLMARSPDHARVAASAWNRPVPFVEDFDIDAILVAMGLSGGPAHG